MRIAYLAPMRHVTHVAMHVHAYRRPARPSCDARIARRGTPYHLLILALGRAARGRTTSLSPGVCMDAPRCSGTLSE